MSVSLPRLPLPFFQTIFINDSYKANVVKPLENKPNRRRAVKKHNVIKRKRPSTLVFVLRIADLLTLEFFG